MALGMIETGRRRELWLALLVLAAAVLVPTAFVLWFMAAAMRNERLAVRQQLTEAYREQALTACRKIEGHWAARKAALAAAARRPAAQTFAACIPLADTVVVYDAEKRIAYPVQDAPPGSAVDLGPEWATAARLEHELNRPDDAAASYAQIASAAKEPQIQALALLAQARCLARAGRKPEALAALSHLIEGKEYRPARDLSGRLIVPNAMLLALEWNDVSSPERTALAGQLSQRLKDYDEPVMPSGQRLFLMESLGPENRSPEIEQYIATEKLAAQYVDMSQPPPSPSSLTPTRMAGVWQMSVPDGTLVALYRLDRIVRESEEAAGIDRATQWTRMNLQAPGSPSSEGETPFLSVPGPETLQGWTLSVFLLGPDPFAEAARRQHVLYLWTGAVGILVIFALALAITTYFARQMRLTRLKNDLIATVSHELKTPLSSMRVLVDTLLEGRCADRGQEREYLRLIAGENQRLTRLIDNFLNFSRMERNRHAFEFGEVRVEEVVRAAAEAFRDRFSAPRCRLEVDVPPDLPAITADRDALVTVLLNLLDNAWKYSGEEKQVAVRVRAVDSSSPADSSPPAEVPQSGTKAGAAELRRAGGVVSVAVQDNGIGLSHRQVRRIFEPFYQVDVGLSRRAGGCGLGLSIVRFIVRAHGGRVDLESEPGKGSTFTVHLPVAGPAVGLEPEEKTSGR